MVYDKKKSGDPDFDDKVPAGDHLTVVTAGDGKVVGQLSDSLGPITPEGAHLSVIDPEELDTRPAPGGVAEYKSDVQTYTAEDVPREEVGLDSLDRPAETTAGLDALKAKDGQKSAGNSGDAVAAENQAAATPAKKTAAAAKK